MPRRDVLLTLIAPLCITALQLRTWRLQPADLSVGDTVVPTLARRWEANADMMAARERMFAAGLYPGVDYQIESREGNVLTVRPIYPLVEKLERDDWPVSVPYELAPRWMSPNAYNLLTAGFTLLLAVGGLLSAAVLASAVTLSVVPSESMVPTILPRDVLLVEKVSPRLGIPLQRSWSRNGVCPVGRTAPRLPLSTTRKGLGRTKR